VRRRVLGEKHRVQSVRGKKPGLVATEIAKLGETRKCDRRHDLPRHAGLARTNERGGTIGIELGRIDMAVAVDERDHATIVADAHAPITSRAGKPDMRPSKTPRAGKPDMRPSKTPRAGKPARYVASLGEELAPDAWRVAQSVSGRG